MYEGECELRGGGWTPLADARRALAHGGEAVAGGGQKVGEPVTPMVGQRRGYFRNENAMNACIHAKAVPTRLDLIASHGCPFQ